MKGATQGAFFDYFEHILHEKGIFLCLKCEKIVYVQNELHRLALVALVALEALEKPALMEENGSGGKPSDVFDDVNLTGLKTSH
jgi:hypothetical protein